MHHRRVIRFLFFLPIIMAVVPYRAAGAPSYKIAFSAATGNSTDIYIMNVDGTNRINLSNNGDKYNLDYFPTWSLDGTRIAFQRQHVEPVSSTTESKPHNQIYVMNADGSGQRNLTNNPEGDYYSPSWSPDGKHITYAAPPGANPCCDIYVMNADGSNPVDITDRYGLNASPVWSPDGKHIAFVSDRDGKPEIYLMGADGSDPTRLTTTSGSRTVNASPNWSPDGKTIAFVSNRDGKFEIYVMNADGSNPIRLTNTPDVEQYPHWSPDGRSILFMVYGVNNQPSQIYLMNADGSNRVKLTDGFGPAWVIEGTLF